GRIFLDQIGECRYQLTDTVLQHRALLKLGESSVADSEANDQDVVLAAVYPGGEAAAIDADAMFKFSLFESATTKELFTVDESLGESSVQSFWDVQAKHRAGSVDVKVLGGSSFAFDCFAFALPRPGKQPLYWSMHSIYDFLGIECFKGTLSKWVFRSSERWERRFPIDGGGQTVHGSCVSSFTAKRVQLSSPAKCLQVTSVSTFGMLFQMAKWSWSPSHYGGFDLKRDSAGKQVKAAQAFIVSVLETVNQYKRPWSFDLVLDVSWTCGWPRPQPSYLENAMIVEVDDSLGVDLKAFCERAQVAWSDTFIHENWNMCLSGRCTRDTFYKLPMMEVLMLTASKATPVAECIIAQVCLSLSHQLQIVMASDNNDGHLVRRDVEFSFDDPAEGFGVGEDVDQSLAKYVTNAAHQLGKPRCVSVATDKASVGNLPLQVSVLALPSNLAVLMPPQVDRQFDDELHEDLSLKRKADEAIVTTASVMERQLAWLTRGAPGARPGAWRPVKLHRVASRRWLQNLDNQLNTCSDLEGLKDFRIEDTTRDWVNWRCLSVSLDLGSDGVCATNALTYFEELKINMLRFPDPSHGANRSIDHAINKTQLRGMWMLMMISFSLPHGPDQDDLRHLQLREAMTYCFNRLSPSTCPLFMELAPYMIQDLNRVGDRLPGVDSPEVELWEYLKKRVWVSSPGERCNTNRFMSSVSAAKLNVPYWHIDLLERLFLCLEMDFVRGKKFLEHMVKVKTGKQEELGEGAPTAANAITLEAKTLRGCAANAVAISALMLSDPMNRKICLSIVALTKPVRDWHIRQNRTLRTSAASPDWLSDQLLSEHVNHMKDIAACFNNRWLLEDLGFSCLDGVWLASEGEMLDDDYIAGVAWEFGWNLISARQRRNMYMHGWPYKLILMTGEGETSRAVVREFQTDKRIFDLLEAAERGSAAEQVFVRSEFRKVATIQFVRAFEDLGYGVHEQIVKLIKDRVSGLIGTQICEDCIGQAKNSKMVIGNRKYRRPEASMATTLKNKVLDGIHKFKGATMSMPLTSKSLRLPDSAFRSSKTNATMEFAKIVSTRQDAPYYSPGHIGINQPVADLYMLRHIFAEAPEAPDFNKVNFSWISSFVQVSHKLVVNLPGQGWCLALDYFNSSCAFFWPMETRELEGGLLMLQPENSTRGPIVKPLFDLDVPSCTVVVKSWARQCNDYPALCVGMNALPPAIRMFQEGPTDGLYKIAASKAFWSVPKTVLQSVARAKGVDLPPGAMLVDVIFALACDALGVSEVDAIKIVARRHTVNDLQASFFPALLEVEEAIQCLHYDDHEEFKSQEKKVVTITEEMSIFKSDFHQKAKAVREAAPKAKAKAKGKAKAKAAGGPPVRRDFPTEFTQAEAKTFLPPGAHIWRAVSHAAWAGHYPPYSRISAPWSMGETAAMKDVIRRLWIQYLTAT
ncbi:unnamed protein product, partial [Prorocentrum cordatum]